VTNRNRTIGMTDGRGAVSRSLLLRDGAFLRLHLPDGAGTLVAAYTETSGYTASPYAGYSAREDEEHTRLLA